MARYSGLVGFVQTDRVRPGVSQEVVVERGPYFGDVKRASLTVQQGDSVNPDLRLTNQIEIVADAYASENIFAIRYVVWAGTPWTVAEVTVQRPRLILRLGGVYNGTRPDESPDSPDAP